MTADDKCTFCDEKAIKGGYIQPPMCEKHHSVAILISMLRGRGQSASFENITLMAIHLPQAKVNPAEVEGLLKPMREGVHNGEQD
jgi:hypothetical protein